MTARVALLTTGRCEQLGLPLALEHALAGHADVTFQALGEFHSFTSATLDVGALGQVPEAAAPRVTGPVDKLADALIAEAAFGSWDLVLAIDDLELANEGDAAGVRRFFLDAVRRAMQRADLTENQRTRVARRASFHLLVPMVEAYFFGERAAVERACVCAGLASAPQWPERTWPIEAFAVTDQVYSDRAASPDLPKELRRTKTAAWQTSDRERHPKHYMEFLCREAPHGYREAREGVAALRKLDLTALLLAGAPHLDDLLEDVRALLQLNLSVLPTRGPLSGTLLRNL